MTRILVVGGSQGIGLAVCRAAIAKGHRVRAMSRTARLPTDIGSDCEAFLGDARNADDVFRALAGIDVVVQALGVPQSLDVILKPVTLFSEATRVLLSAMSKAGIGKLVAVTGFGAGDSHEAINILQRLPFRLIFKNAYDDKSIQEALIAASELQWLIVRPGVLVDCASNGNYKVLTRASEWRNGIVARADVADFIIKRIEADTLNREKPVIIRYPL
ncbi:MAG: NAD(P)-dependent oxidoreductase [Hyphomicrobiaceae bacterium]